MDYLWITCSPYLLILKKKRGVNLDLLFIAFFQGHF
nr:MAG TPA: hypothetical protein [Caudoviricetes sp.]